MAYITHSRKRYQKLVLGGNSGLTTSRDWNVAGLSSAIALATELRTKYSAHIANATIHKSVHTAAQLAGSSVVPTDLTSLLALVNDLTAKYTLHDDDAAATSPTYHQADEGAGYTLASTSTVTTLSGAITRLNDLKSKFNSHDAGATAHTTGSLYQVSTVNAALGTSIKVVDDGVKPGDIVVWSILNRGSGSVNGVSATAYDNYIIFNFSADPQDDAVISYLVVSD